MWVYSVVKSLQLSESFFESLFFMQVRVADVFNRVFGNQLRNVKEEGVEELY